MLFSRRQTHRVLYPEIPSLDFFLLTQGSGIVVNHILGNINQFDPWKVNFDGAESLRTATFYCQSAVDDLLSLTSLTYMIAFNAS